MVLQLQLILVKRIIIYLKIIIIIKNLRNKVFKFVINFLKLLLTKLYTHMSVDLTYLEKMSGGDSELIQEMIGIFKEQVLEFKIQMSDMLEEQNWKGLGKLAHKAKSSVSIMGMDDLAKDLKTLELITEEEKDPEIYSQYVNRFILECENAVGELDNMINNL